MTRFTRMFGVLSLSSAMALGASAQDKPKTDLEKLADRVTDIEKSLRDLQTNTTNANNNVLSDVSAIKLELEKLVRKLDGKAGETKSNKIADRMPSDGGKAPVDTPKVEDLQKNLDGIYQSLSTIQSAVNELKASNRETRSIDRNPVRTGNVRVVNQYLMDMTVYINGRRYELQPNQEITIKVPAGQFNYQVPGVEEFVRTREVKADDTFRVDIR